MANFIFIVAIASSLMFILGTLILGQLTKNFSFRSMPISELSKFANHAKLFRLLFFIYSLLEIVFMTFLLFYSPLASVVYIPLLLLVAPVLGIPVSLYFDNARHKTIHRICAIIGFGSALLGSILLGTWILGQSTVVAVIDLLLSFSISALLLFGLFRHKSVPAVYEYSLFAGELIWKVVNLPLLLR